MPVESNGTANAQTPARADGETTAASALEAVRASIDGLDTADEMEAAAIASAILTHLRDEARANATDSESDSWDGNRWTFAGRLESTASGRFERVPKTAPRDAWSASGRRDRF